MHDAVISIVLLAGIVLALIFTRSRSLLMQITIEAADAAGLFVTGLPA